jgi:hypothetical protein
MVPAPLVIIPWSGAPGRKKSGPFGPLEKRQERGGKSQGRRCKMKSRQLPRRSDWKRRRFWKRVEFTLQFAYLFWLLGNRATLKPITSSLVRGTRVFDLILMFCVVYGSLEANGVSSGVELGAGVQVELLEL